MLDSVLTFLESEINVYVRKRTGIATDMVEAGPIADDQGKWAVKEGQLRLALINIEEERALRSQVPQRALQDGSHIILQPDLKLNLVLMIAGRLKNYADTLRYLSHVMTFFQAHSAFSAAEYPGLDPRIAMLSVELLAYGPEQLNQTWAYLGTKYLPSVVYRVRMVVLQDVEPLGIGKPITTIETAIHDK
jgi:hypothetical protein